MPMARLLLPVSLFLVEFLEATVAVGDNVAQRLMRRIADDASAARHAAEQHLSIRSEQKTTFGHKFGTKHATHVMAFVDAWGGMSHTMNSSQVPSQPQVAVGSPNTAATAMVPASGVPVAQSVNVGPGVAAVPVVASSSAGQPAAAGLQPMAPQAWQMTSAMPTAAGAATPSQNGAAVVPTPNATSPNATDSGSNGDSNPLFRVLFILGIVGLGLVGMVLYFFATESQRHMHQYQALQATDKDKKAIETARNIQGPYPSPTPGVNDDESIDSFDDNVTVPEPEGEAAIKNGTSSHNGSQAIASGKNGNGTSRQATSESY